MEFHITMFGAMPDVCTIAHAIHTVDPSALVDTDPAAHTIRISASIDAGQLIALMDQAGHPVGQHQVLQIPSVCCGGCSG